MRGMRARCSSSRLHRCGRRVLLLLLSGCLVGSLHLLPETALCIGRPGPAPLRRSLFAGASSDDDFATGRSGSWGASYVPNPPDVLKFALVMVSPAVFRWPGFAGHVAFVLTFPAYLALLRAWPGPSWLGGKAWVTPPSGAASGSGGDSPDLLQSPLGGLATGGGYRGYVSCGAIFGVLLPGALLLASLLSMALGAFCQGQTLQLRFAPAMDSAVAHTSLLMAQILTEDYHRRRSFPPMLRILVPIVYNTVRLPVLWTWVGASLRGGWSAVPMATVALGNFLFWHFNLLFFLLPIASRAYAKSYFHLVEKPSVDVSSLIFHSLHSPVSTLLNNMPRSVVSHWAV
mmetsp:Transcript_171015/g.548007  ORF Transcript_171015/g.548007 Transcript_171015/m.548007 type:complete len:344 (+) Transcript_171015:44-1075(+)